MNRGKFQIDHGISSREQESSFMNATLQSHRDNLCLSVAVNVSFPDGVDTRDPAAVERHLRGIFAPLQDAGCDVHIQAGPDEEVEDELAEAVAA